MGDRDGRDADSRRDAETQESYHRAFPGSTNCVNEQRRSKPVTKHTNVKLNSSRDGKSASWVGSVRLKQVSPEDTP